MRNIGLGDRMKQYEQVTQIRLIRRMPVISDWTEKAFTALPEALRSPLIR